MDTNRFGSIVTAFDVAKAVRAHLIAWMPDYIADMSEASGRVRGALPPFASYFLATELEKFTEKALPGCVIFVPAVDADFRDGRVEGGMADVRIGSFVQGIDSDNSLELAMIYDAAVHAIASQHPGWGGDPRVVGYKGFASSSRWMGSRYDIVPVEESRQLGAAVTMFHVGVSHMVSSADGITAPTDDPGADPGAWPEANEVTVGINWKG